MTVLLAIPVVRFSVTFTSFVLSVLAVWRVTHLFWGEDGPWDIFVRLRRLAGGGFFGRLLDCFYCLSLWVAAPFAVALSGSWVERAILWVSLSGGAILLERATKVPTPPPAIWRESPTKAQKQEEEPTNVMLR